MVIPPSRCPECGERLKPLDLIPVFSYLWLMGKCRHCGERISPRYPLVEVLTALLFTAAFLRFGFGWELLRAWVLVGVLVVAAGTDLDCYRIPDKLTGFGVAAGLLLGAMSIYPIPWPGLLWAVMGLAAGGGIVLLVVLVSRGGMGGGDVKLAAATGTFLGPAGAVLFFFLAAALAAVVGLALVALGRKGMRSALPFGPFLAVSGLLVLFFGNGIINWYLSLWPLL